MNDLKVNYIAMILGVYIALSISACSPKHRTSTNSSESVITNDTIIERTEEEVALGSRFPKGVTESEYQRHKVENKIVKEKRIEPPFWWIGMKEQLLEVLIHDYLIKGYRVSVDYPGVEVKDVHKVESRNYLFVELEIAKNALPGKFKIVLTRGDDVRTYDYELKAKTNEGVQGIGPQDVIYLLMPRPLC